MRRSPISVRVLCLSVLALAGLSGVVVAVGTAGRSGAGAGGPYGTGLKLGKRVIDTAPVEASVAPWYRWNRKACKFEVAPKHPAKYTAAIRNILGGERRIGYMHYGNTDPFGIANSKSVEDWAKKAGMPLDVYNLKYPSRTEPIADAQSAVVKHDAGVLQANLDSTILPAFFKVLEGQGCIPSVQLYIPIAGHPAMGTNWPDLGRLLGKYIAGEARRRGWKPSDTALVQCMGPSEGPTVNIMFKVIPPVLSANGFDIPEKNRFTLTCEPSEIQSGFKELTFWFTAHPNFKHIAMTAVDTVRMPNMIRAIKMQRLNRRDWISAAGADDKSSRALVRSGDQDVSVSFLGERYGEYLISMIEDIMAGNPVPSVVGNKLIPLTKQNIGKYYPNG
jgi:ribose transport system substrate-binding protein